MEIERKYLVHHDRWNLLDKPRPVQIAQGYLYSDADKTIRVRIKGEKGFITIKGKTVGISRPEFEYEIPQQDAETMLRTLCAESIEKWRYEIPLDGFLWEVDVFSGLNAGLIVAEVELENETDAVVLPEWIAEEVSADSRYFNANLVRLPFSKW